METNKEFAKGLEGSERIKAIVERFGDRDSFLMKCTPEMQIPYFDRERAVLGEYPTVKDVNLAYGKDTECQDLKVSEVLHFFYCLKSGRLHAVSDSKSPMSVIVNLQCFLSERNSLIWLSETESIRRVFLIIEDQPKTKVYARVFRTRESAEKALEERDYRTGERLYPACHIIERTIE